MMTQLFGQAGWTQVAKSTAVFIAWTVTSFLCHENGKMFLQLSETNLIASTGSSHFGARPVLLFCVAFILTTVQCMFCFLLVQPENRSWDLFRSRAMFLLVASHVLATFATNYSMAFIEAASTLAIKLTEPITMAVAHHVIFRTPVPLHTAISLPLIIFGALVFTGYKLDQVTDSSGIALAFTSNIILAVRNITLKKLQLGATANAGIVLRPSKYVATSLAVQICLLLILYFLGINGKISPSIALLVGLSTASGIFHVAYSYISTSIVLKVMNVVSHSIANIFKRFLVVLLLSLFGHRHISAANILGLVLAVCGLLIYSHGKMQSQVELNEQDQEKNEKRTTSRRKLATALTFLALTSIITIGSLGTLSFPVKMPLAASYQEGNVYREYHGLYQLEEPSVNFSHLEKAETNPEMREFLSWRLVDYPEETDKRAQILTNNEDVVEEAQRILVNLLKDLLGNVKHVMLLEMATYENKGDPAIAVGEIMLLRRMNISIVFYCETSTCNNNTLTQALQVNSKYAKDELIILLQGGGNLVGYSSIDNIRRHIIKTFPDRKIILLSQSIWFTSNKANHLEYCRHVYSNRSNLIMFLRDRQSLEIAKANFLGVKLILAPDMAFGIGMVPRQLPPIYDIVWLRRSDGESSKYTLPVFPSNLSVEVADWHGWKSNRGQTGMENTFLIASAGFQFLQRGRIVVTDRLHGHILSTLMNIPHVLIDNPPHLKLSSFDNSWTKSLSNTIRVSNGTLALEAAKELLKRYHSSLPSLGPKDMYVIWKKKV